MKSYIVREVANWLITLVVGVVIVAGVVWSILLSPNPTF